MVEISKVLSQGVLALFLAWGVSFSCLFPVSVAHAQDAPAKVTPPNSEWEKTSDHDGIEVFRKETPGSQVIAFRGQGIVDAPIAKVASVVVDVERATEWVDKLEDAKILRRLSDSDYIRYNHIGTPIVMKDRDFVIHNHLSVNAKEGTFLVTLKSTEDELAPPSSYVRGEILSGMFSLKSIENGTKTYVITEMHADPKGDVAKWIVNMFQKGWPRNTIDSLRKQAAKKDIKILPFFEKTFP